MIQMTLPDGKVLPFEKPVTGFEIAEKISRSLAKNAVAIRLNGKLVDLMTTITEDATLQIITKTDKEGLEVLRHSCAHLLAHAVKTLFPSAQVTIGPVIENGFYYDFAFERPFTPEDLERIEAKMREIAAKQYPISRHEIERAAAVSRFSEMGEKYKVEIIQSIPGTETLSFYEQGDFIDLCRGPHLPNTSFLKDFKLQKVAGAYWRGDSKAEMLQRIYGTCFASKEELAAYLLRIEEEEKRDHRKLAKKLNLFHIQEEAPGMVFWHPNGWIIYTLLMDFIRKTLTRHGYQEVHTPEVVDRKLWERSGHWDKFRQNMFTVQIDERDYAIKPMNCPCHVQIFNQGLKSYRDLPLRLAEFGSCHRYEASGALHGLMRVRNMVQDDAHIFCTESQIQTEVANFIKLLHEVYEIFGFHQHLLVKLSTRPEERVGSDEIWDKAEHALAAALQSLDIPFEYLPGEGAFYGPKIEFTLKDCIGRLWQCGTIQVDFSMPERLGAEYIDEDSSRKTPVMLHRAILGSLERFIGILIEEYTGAFPLWLAPIQAQVLTITEKHTDYAKEITEFLQKHALRVQADLRNEKIGFKIREHSMARTPYLFVVGDREMQQREVAVRTRDGKELGVFGIEDVLKHLQSEINSYGKMVWEEISH